MSATLAPPRPDGTDGTDGTDGVPTRHRVLVGVYTATGSLGAALLFLVEPMMARQLLPRLGGSAAVWNTAMVFFQGSLLVGYLVAHASRRHRGAILGVLAAGLLTLPLSLPDWAPPGAGREPWWVLGILAVSVGVPFVGLATLGPTLQRWFADTDHPRAADPYFLYAAGNVGSVLGLLAYPVVVEPTLGLADQRRWWSVGFGLTLALGVLCAVLRRRHRSHAVTAPAASGSVGAISWGRRLRWVGLAAVPSGLLLGVTRHLSTDVAAVPLLWVLPLLVYLGTFVIAFRRGDAPSDQLRRVALLVAIPIVATLVGGVGSALVAVAIGVAGFGLLALVCHRQLASERPAATELTGYYLWISVGGAVGGISVALVAPVVFDRVTEYPLLLTAAFAIVAAASPRDDARGRSRTERWALGFVVGSVALAAVLIARSGPEHAELVTQVLGVGAGVAYVVARVPRRAAIALAALALTTIVVDARPALSESRTFFGVYRVRADERGRHVFEHGTTIHGQQFFDPEPRTDPLTYYTRDSGIGRTFAALHRGEGRRPLDVGVVGLGAGTLATYGRTGDRLDFYEIDGEVVRIAEDPGMFTFLADSRATVTTTVGDGRLAVAGRDTPMDLLVLDAFSSDAIPVHLLTVEAMQEYRDQLAAGGVVAVHISNRFFDLAPVVARLGESIGMKAHRRETAVSTWMLLTPRDAPSAVRAEVQSDRWTDVAPDPSAPRWTDDFSNLLAVLQ